MPSSKHALDRKRRPSAPAATKAFVFVVLAGTLSAPAQESGRSLIEYHDGLRVVHLFGDARERGRAHGRLLGRQVVALARAELGARFGRKPRRLDALRRALPRMIRFPADQREEIAGILEGIRAAGYDLRLEELDRDLDQRDLELANALDVFAPMSCSGVTVWGDRVVGGGVLTTRNFDWPYTCRELVDEVVLLVQHPREGPAYASLAWPGYTGVVTGINEYGIACFLHVGNGRITLAPEPESLPTASAARRILAAATPQNAARVAARELAETSPPISYITRVVLPRAPADAAPVNVFETDARRVVRRLPKDYCVVTNHFLARTDVRGVSLDSRQRYEQIEDLLTGYLTTGDHRVSVAEAWVALRRVQRGGRRAFGTLHSIVFRAAPWTLEIAIAEPTGPGRVAPAPASPGRRARLPRAALFGVQPGG